MDDGFKLEALMNIAKSDFNQSDKDDISMIVSLKEYFELQLDYSIFAILRRKYFGYNQKEIDLLFNIVENIEKQFTE